MVANKESKEKKSDKILFNLEDFFINYKFDKLRLVLSSIVMICMVYGKHTENKLIEILGWIVLILLMCLKKNATNILDINKNKSLILLIPLSLLLSSIYFKIFKSNFMYFTGGFALYLLAKLFMVINELELTNIEQITNLIFIGVILLYEFSETHKRKNEHIVNILFIVAWIIYVIDQSRQREEDEDRHEIHE
jgi:hypothetical protein